MHRSAGGVFCQETPIGVEALESIGRENFNNCGLVDVPCDALYIHVEQKSAVLSNVLEGAICSSRLFHVNGLVRWKEFMRKHLRDVKVVSRVSFSGGESEQARCIHAIHIRDCARQIELKMRDHQVPPEGRTAICAQARGLRCLICTCER